MGLSLALSYNNFIALKLERESGERKQVMNKIYSEENLLWHYLEDYI